MVFAYNIVYFVNVTFLNIFENNKILLNVLEDQQLNLEKQKYGKYVLVCRLN